MQSKHLDMPATPQKPTLLDRRQALWDWRHVAARPRSTVAFKGIEKEGDHGVEVRGDGQADEG